jgi:hypothetical protein
MKTAKEIDAAIIRSVIDDARWLIWKSATPEQIERVIEYKKNGYDWYCAGTGWVFLANFEGMDPATVIMADTKYGCWQFCDENIPALSDWHGLKSWDWKKEIGR